MEIPLETQIGNMLRQKKLTLATAESCTGGLIGHRVTNAPGSSDYYLGGIVAYAYSAKVNLLGVKWKNLDEFGAVSQEVVLEMAGGARKGLDSDIGLAVSGIAGPGGGLPDKPVGTIWIGLNIAGEEIARHYHFQGTRQEIKAQTAEQALNLLLLEISLNPQ